ncbi:hypothetical protein WOLCODRAFT_104513 [Wolfiporia cocos MD-104 SS10]|uniref:Uncharacterized protein n=1 Tax=Wolfiporia cocos (strain MD-104) TaxID=742152 RepID=A0A2H3JRB8_WOLCO|nr:hypothetical protein WOLCODRAFT_104513 [Wolfiporia cocos MD-104 SS10]
MFAAALFSFVFAASALAHPSLVARQSLCKQLGAGADDTLSYNFTLAAGSPSSPIDDPTTGSPMVMAIGGAGTSGQASTWVITAAPTANNTDWPNFSLVNGALVPNAGSTQKGLAAYDMSVNPGDEVQFMVTTANSGETSELIYCSVSDASGNAVLAVNGDANSFFECNDGSRDVLVYKASSSSTQYHNCGAVNVILRHA